MKEQIAFWIVYCAGSAIVALLVPLAILEAWNQWSKVFKVGKYFHNFLLFQKEFKSWYDREVTEKYKR